jgi:hypothetical protein
MSPEKNNETFQQICVKNTPIINAKNSFFHGRKKQKTVEIFALI